MKRHLIGLGLGLGLATALMASVSGAAAAGKTLYFGMSGEPSTLEPSVNAGTPARTIRLAIHRGLLNYGADGKLSNELASNYTISDDGKTYTFKLRDAKFHDGSPVTAADVKATFDRILAPDSKATYKNDLAVITTVATPDDKTVVFVLSTSFAPFVHYLALPESAVLPKSWIAAAAANPNLPPVGAGPFKFAGWSKGREVVVKKFDAYYKAGKPKLDEVHYAFYADENTRVNALRSGDADIIDYVPWKDADTIDNDPKLHLQSTTGPFMMLQFNTHFEPFSKPEVRQAIAYAIDRKVIINTAFDGRGTPLYGIAIPKGYPGYSDKSENAFRYDPAKAKELLAKAGYPNGFKARLLSTAQYGFHKNTAVAVQAELAKIGITAELDLPDWSTRIAKNTKGDYDFLVAGTAGDITDPDWLSNFFYGGGNLVRLNNSAYFNDTKINELLDDGRVTVDPAKREAIYKAFVDRAIETSPFVYLMWRDQSYGVSDKVKGFTNMPGFLSFQSGFTVEDTSVE
jgi:glutathione transport system substrate-binding protein